MTEITNIAEVQKFLERWYVLYGVGVGLRTQALVDICVRLDILKDVRNNKNIQARSRQFGYFLDILAMDEHFRDFVAMKRIPDAGNKRKIYSLRKRPGVEHETPPKTAKYYKPVTTPNLMFKNYRSDETFQEIRKFLDTWYRTYGARSFVVFSAKLLCIEKKLLKKTLGNNGDLSRSRQLGILLRDLSGRPGYSKILMVENYSTRSTNVAKKTGEMCTIPNYTFKVCMPRKDWPIDEMEKAEATVLGNYTKAVSVAKAALGHKDIPDKVLEGTLSKSYKYNYRVDFLGSFAETLKDDTEEAKDAYAKQLCSDLIDKGIICDGVEFIKEE